MPFDGSSGHTVVVLNVLLARARHARRAYVVPSLHSPLQTDQTVDFQPRRRVIHVGEEGYRTGGSNKRGGKQTQLKRVRFIGHEGPEKWASAVAEHERMITALEARDADGLSDILGRHLTLAWERVRDDLPAQT